MLAIIKKELNSYFKTPIGYIYLAAFIAMYCIFFYDFFTNYVADNVSANFHYTFNPMIIVTTFLIPILTMKLFSEEKKQGTELLLLSSPTKTISIILGKFIAAVVMVLISMALTLILYVVVLLCTESGYDISGLISTYIGYLLLSMCYISIGMLFSIFTENQIISYIITVAVILLVWLMPGLADYAPANKFNLFLQGAISWNSIIYFVSFIVAFLGINTVFLENRKWNK